VDEKSKEKYNELQSKKLGIKDFAKQFYEET